MTPPIMLFGRPMRSYEADGVTEHTAKFAGLLCVIVHRPDHGYTWRIDAWGMPTHAFGTEGMASLAVAEIERRLNAVGVALKRGRW